MYTITITADTAEDLRLELLRFMEHYRERETLADKIAKTRGRPPKAAVEPAPVEPIEDEEPDEVEEPETMTADAIANEKMKQEIVATLSAMYTAGKVKFVRGLLAKYGDGAKTFHEIDASVFPAIKEAMKGEAA